MSLDNQLIGQNIKALRKELGMTQIAFAEAVQIKQSALSRYEQGQTLPDAEVIANICTTFHISADRLLGIAKAPELSSADDFAAMLTALTNAAGVYPVYLCSNGSRDKRGEFAQIRFYRDDSPLSTEFYEALLLEMGNGITITRNGKTYQLSHAVKDTYLTKRGH